MSMRMPPVHADVGQGEGRLVRMEAMDVLVGYGSTAFALIGGFVAGLLVWIPVALLLYLNRFLMMAGSSSAPSITPQPAVLDFGAIWPYWIATGVAGLVLAWLRRVSARIGWYKEIASFRLGLNGVVASIGGAVVCLWLIFSGSNAGFLVAILSFGVIIGGFLFNAVWEWFHNLTYRVYNPKAQDKAIEGAVKHVLNRYDHLKPERLDSVTVTNGRVSLKGVWPNLDKRREVETELRGIAGVALVQFERTSD